MLRCLVVQVSPTCAHHCMCCPTWQMCMHPTGKCRDASKQDLESSQGQQRRYHQSRLMPSLSECLRQEGQALHQKSMSPCHADTSARASLDGLSLARGTGGLRLPLLNEAMRGHARESQGQEHAQGDKHGHENARFSHAPALAPLQSAPRRMNRQAGADTSCSRSQNSIAWVVFVLLSCW